MFAKAKRAEEQNPCEIIKTTPPPHPQEELEKAPASINDICPIEE
jgi:hypothetical protein